MSRPRNPNPPIRTHLVKQKKYGGTWYVMERKVQYSNEKGQTLCLDSKAVGVLLNKDDDIKDMIPIDIWNEQQEQRKQEKKRLAKEKKKNAAQSINNAPSINDTCTTYRIRYKPQHLLILMMAAVGAGHKNCHSAAAFLNARIKKTAKIFAEFKGIELSCDCLHRFVCLLSKDSNEALLHEFNQMLIDEVLTDELQSCDKGKEAGNKRAGYGTGYVLGVCDSDSGLVLSQEAAGVKAHEIKHVEELLQKIDISGAIVAADALHATARFINAVLTGGGHYLIKIQNTNPVLKEWIEGLFKAEHPDAMQFAGDKANYGQGHTVNRSVRVLPGSLLDPALKGKWPCAEEGTVAELTSVREDLMKKTTSTEVCYLFSSLPYSEKDTARTLLSADRPHRVTEKTHWMLDIVYNQDRTQCTHGEFLKGMTLLNRLASNFAWIAMKKEEKRLGRKISQDEFNGIFSNIEEFFRLYMDIVKNPEGGEA